MKYKNPDRKAFIKANLNTSEDLWKIQLSFLPPSERVWARQNATECMAYDESGG